MCDGPAAAQNRRDDVFNGGDDEEQELHGVEKRLGPCPLRIGMTVRDRYVVEELLGQGTRGLVFAARRLDDNVRVVLKVSDTSKEFSNELWITEQGLQPKIRSPAAWETFKLMRRPWTVCVMECLGDNLLAIFDQYKGREAKVQVAARQLLEGLAAAHDVKIAHCDLQPLNVCAAGDAWRLIDWGMAQDMEKLYGEKKLGQGPKGCVAYQSPEMLAGLNWDLSTDVWSFGIILAELYLGEFWNAPRSWEESSNDNLNTMEATWGRLPGKLRKGLGDRSQFGQAWRFFARFPPLLGDVLKQLLNYSWNWRSSARDALKHAWFQVPSLSIEDLEAWLERTFVEYEKDWKLSDIEKSSIGACISVVATKGQAANAYRWLQRAMHGELSPDLNCFSAVVEGLLREKRAEEMASVVQMIAEKDLKPKEEFCVEAVRARATINGFEAADALLQLLDRKGARLSPRVFTQLLAPAAKSGNVDEAEKALKRILEKGMDPDIGFATAFIQAHANTSEPDPSRAADAARRILGSAPIAVNGPLKVALERAVGKERFVALSEELEFEKRNALFASKGGKGQGKFRGR